MFGCNSQPDDAAATLGIPDVSYADDLACVIPAEATEVVNVLEKAGMVAWRVYVLCGFRVNFEVKNPAAEVRWTGKLSHTMRRALEQAFVGGV